MDINQTIAQELGAQLWQVEATVNLLQEGITVPFIARYRKEVTGSLTDTQLRTLEERLNYLTELEDRRKTILGSIESQGKLTPELSAAIMEADNKARLEDLYLPYKPKRRTKAQIAIEAGLEPLADALLTTPELDPKQEAEKYLNTEHSINSIEDALLGAKHILTERFSEHADLITQIREYIWAQSTLKSVVAEDKKHEALKFQDYFDFQEPIRKIPSHRALALLRGQKENFLRISLELTEEDYNYIKGLINECFSIAMRNRPSDAWLQEVVDWSIKIKIKLKIDVDLILRLREAAEEDAIQVFKDNLSNLLMASPGGHKVVLGLDPGLRTGVKVVVVDAFGKLLFHTAIYPHAPKNQWDESIQILAKLCETFKIELVSIGNGTASRETDRLVLDLMKQHPALNLTKIIISEAGASVYSASELAANEFPDLDVSYRGAVSIARRLQDPLAELVKIDPKSIGVGQYQHDVNQIKLGRVLNNVVEDCVNSVGADVNTASVPLLKSIAGLNETVAQNIVKYREANGPFKNRAEIKKVSRLGEKTYEQAIGFLRIINGTDPLDASAVHPEAYPIVEKIIKQTGLPIQSLMGNAAAVQKLVAQDFVDDDFGVPTIKDIFVELVKPGRDPRPEFTTAQFKEGVETLNDLKPNMALEGVVTNVTKFGAFVDIGVHQDGLVHISELSDQYVTDPNQVVKAGQIVKVKVLEVDLQRKRIQLTMKTKSTEGGKQTTGQSTHNAFQSNGSKQKYNNQSNKSKAPQQQSALADALMSALKK
ncbi:MAG: Tex family protein [Candidatus Berkiella sp.]